MDIVTFWGKFWQWCKTHGLVNDECISIGMSHDDPQITPPQKCRFDACIVVDENFKPSAGVNIQEIPGGKHAVFKFRGTNPDIQVFFRNIYSKWLPESGYLPDDKAPFELYRGDNNYDCNTGIFSCDVCIPVKPM